MTRRDWVIYAVIIVFSIVSSIVMTLLAGVWAAGMCGAGSAVLGVTHGAAAAERRLRRDLE